MASSSKSGSGVDLEGLSIEALKSLRGEIEKRMEDVKRAGEQEAFARLDEMAKTLGLDGGAIAKHFRGKSRKVSSRSPAVQKYRNPKNPAQTWSGRGRKPAWVHSHLDGGGDLDALGV